MSPYGHSHVLEEAHNKIDTDDVLLIFWSLYRVELSVGSIVLQLSPVA
jgi:hypothetical protein